MGISPRRSGRSAAAPHPSQSTQSPPSPRKRRNSLQSYNQSPPPREEQPLTSPALDDDDEEDEEDDGSAEITRCVCGSQDYPFPDADVEDTGFMICCERCNVWQHGPCVGVMSENEAPDVYFCEECRPDLHELGSRNQGHRQSRWIGSSIPQQPSRRKKSSASVIQGSLKGDQSLSPPPSDKDTLTSKMERKPSPKKRSTMNSRDAAYDYSAMFTTATSTAGGDEDVKIDESGSPPTSRSGDSRSRRRGKRAAEDEDDESPSLSTARGRKRRRASNDTEDRPDNLPEAVSSATLKSKNKRTSVKRAGRDDSDTVDGIQTKDDSSDNQHSNTTPLLEAPPAGSRHGKRPYGGAKRKNNLAKSERVDSEEPPTPTLRRAPQGLEDVIRPARARIPQARSGLNEMRKRVGAILEYVGRLQADVAATGSQTPSGTSCDDSDMIEKPDMDNAPSVVIMEYLTKRCLDFEIKFGKYPGRYG